MGKKIMKLDRTGAVQNPIFLSVEHIGLYPTRDITADEIAEWYAENLGMNKVEGKASFFLSSSTNPGRIEVLKEPFEDVKCHIAVQVSNFEEACRILKDKGIELQEPRKVYLSISKEGTKIVYLKKTDPIGNRIHLIYKP